MEKKKILVIGGSGFIGTNLVAKLLDAGHIVRIIDKQMSQEFPDICTLCDIRDKDKLIPLCTDFDVMYNLAAEHKDNVTPVSLYDEVNIGGARNTSLAAEINGIKKIIFTSSVAVYGFSNTELSEDGELKPFNHYGRTKMEAEKVYKKWQKKSDANGLVIIRPTVVFGINNRGNVYNLMNQIAHNKFIMIGNGENKKSMAYLENVTGFLIYSLKLGKGCHLYNYIDKPDFDMNTLVGLIKESLRLRKNGFKIPYTLGILGGTAFDILSFFINKKFPISLIRIKKFCANTLFSSEKMLKSGFKPPFSLEEGLKKTVEKEFNK